MPCKLSPPVSGPTLGGKPTMSQWANLSFLLEKQASLEAFFVQLPQYGTFLL